MKPDNGNETVAGAGAGASGIVFDIQNFSLHDGPGIRTTVFLKGCPLGCLWCHNPESWSAKPQMSWTPRLCINCGACVPVCPTGAQGIDKSGRRHFDRAKCIACGRCAEACPTRAMEISGRTMTVGEVMDRVLADKPFYEKSGNGGMTVSGGEPLMQAEFTDALLVAARANGVHTSVETSGAGRPADVERIAGHSDIVLFDLKAAPGDYERLTRLDYATALRSLRAVAKAGCPMWLRLPLIPGVNDTDAHFWNVAEVVAEINPERVDVLPYHNLGVEKRDRFGMPEGATAKAVTPDDEVLASWQDRFHELGVEVHS